MSDVSGPCRRPILVVDDDPQIRLLLVELLTLKGYSVVTAENGAEALAIFAQHPPGLVLLDVHMPRMDGLTFASRLSAVGRTVPIVVLTASPDAHLLAAEICAV